MRLRVKLLLFESAPGGGYKSCSEILAPERKLGDVGARQCDGGQQFPLRGIAAHLPAAEQGDPDAAFGIDRRAVGPARALLDLDEGALAGKPGPIGDVKAIDGPGECIRMIKNLAVRAECGSIRDLIAGIA